jgi:6,7-dimethyl-8-ribityllumazine synthase
MNHKYFEENIEGSKMSKKSPSRYNFEINKDLISSVHIAVVAAKWNSNITDNLVKGAQSVLKNSGIPEKNIDIFRVPGAFELPLACQKLTNIKKQPRAIMPL